MKDGFKIPTPIVMTIIGIILTLIGAYTSLAMNSQKNTDNQIMANVSQIRDAQGKDEDRITGLEQSVSDIRGDVKGLQATIETQNLYFKKAFGLK